MQQYHIYIHCLGKYEIYIACIMIVGMVLQHLQYCIDNSYMTDRIGSIIVSYNVLSSVWVNRDRNISIKLYMVFDGIIIYTV